MGDTVYQSLTAWRSGTGQERLGTTAVGFAVDPKLTNPGGGGTIGNPDQLTTLAAYRLQSSSPMVDAGLNLPLLFGVNVGSRDYYGSSIPRSRVRRGSPRARSNALPPAPAGSGGTTSAVSSPAASRRQSGVPIRRSTSSGKLEHVIGAVQPPASGAHRGGSRLCPTRARRRRGCSPSGP
jgi:hypothetical protein